MLLGDPGVPTPDLRRPKRRQVDMSELGEEVPLENVPVQLFWFEPLGRDVARAIR